MRLYAALFVAQFFGFPLVSVIPVFAGMDSRPISIVYRISVVLLTFLVVFRAVKEGWHFQKSPFAITALALAFLLVGRMAWDAAIVRIPLDLPWTDEWVYLFGVTIFPMLAFVVVPTHECFDQIRKLSAWVGCATIVVVIAATIYVLRNARSFGRLSTDTLNPISLAQMAISCLIAINARAIAGIPREARSPIRSSMRWFMTIVCILVVIASVSKGPILALLTVSVVAMLFRGRFDRTGRGLAIRLVNLSIVLLLGMGLLFIVDRYTPVQVISRFVNARGDNSTSTRIDLINGALSQFESSPIVGSSFVEYTSKFYPHNIIIEVMMTNGIVGLAALIVTLFGCFYFVGRMLLCYPSERWIALLFIQYFVVSMFSGSLYFEAVIWATMLLVLNCSQSRASLEMSERMHGVVFRDQGELTRIAVEDGQ